MPLERDTDVAQGRHAVSGVRLQNPDEANDVSSSGTEHGLVVRVHFSTARCVLCRQFADRVEATIEGASLLVPGWRPIPIPVLCVVWSEGRAARDR